ncbi:MAG: isoleucine--tRNA ligase [Candidatus Margulisiibacteriota bacterium]
MEYKNTLNLPKTDFPIRANLKTVEEELLAKWENEDIYAKIQAKNQGKDKYILHDGPPYPNGDIHLGHALNKILKDIIVKYKAMSGFSSPYIPGWDCHGLPIEIQLLKEIGDKRKEMSITEFRQKCKEYALNFVDLQRKEFKKLGIFAEWENPYLTINHTYEAKTIELFGILAEKDYVYRGLKPIHWCPSCETALAEAELEYQDDRSPSIYVKFEIRNLETCLPAGRSEINSKIQNPKLPFELPWFMIIWTTTPWTLPANVAVCANPELEYVFLKVSNEIYIVAEGLLDSFIAKLDIKDHTILDKTKGKYLEGILCRHPFIERDVPVVLGDLVTLEQGTGLVHIAPGHGQEDYLVGLKYKLPIVMPVDERGYFDNTVPEFIAGKHYDESNKIITEKLKLDGALLKLEFMKHSYPHCWRCKKPVIFRATEQWFISVDKNDLRREALKAIGDTKWYPAWGENRIRGMVEGRPDWCISRQRSWGIPIPAFYCKSCKEPLVTGVFNKAIRELVQQEGTNGWFTKEAKDILPKGIKCPKCGAEEFEKEKDILDVWFESGSSHIAVLETNPNLKWPADLYLEGSDQHRGWFQTSLLTAVGYKGRAPFNAVLTHGFTIDEKGKKMSKSTGNVVDPQDVATRYGADVLRLWVASTDFRNDIAASEKILKQVQDAYSKIRNTCRFLISNLSDYTVSKLPTPNSDLVEIDRWILLRLHRLIERVCKAYDEYEFHLVYHSIYDFCVNDLSALYLDMSKDRLYCERKDSVERRSAQFAMHEILSALTRLLAPILSFTSEDILKYSGNQKTSIFLTEMPSPDPLYLDEKLETKWETILLIKEKVNRKLEEARAKKEIGSAIEAHVEICAKGKELELLRSIENLLPTILIVAGVKLSEGENEPLVLKASGVKCQRCWILRETVGTDKEHPTLCTRCANVVR